MPDKQTENLKQSLLAGLQEENASDDDDARFMERALAITDDDTSLRPTPGVADDDEDETPQ